jgi:hypothetical protein
MKKKNFLFSLILINNIICNDETLKIYNFFEELYDKRRTEYIALKLLQKKPIKKNINFLAAPWHVLHVHNLHNKKPNFSDLQHLKLNGGFAVCAHDNYRDLIPLLKQIGINTLFAAGASKNNNDNFNVICIPYYSMNGVKPAKNKDIYYSFLGSLTHPIRKKIFELKHPKNTVVIRREQFHYNMPDKVLRAKREEEYRNILSRSRFSLCPRGASPGSIRFWESLEAGAIPILISDDYQLPKGFDWRKCIIKVAEKDITRISEILARVSPAQEAELRRNCLVAYKRFSGKNFANIIRNYYK